MSPAPIAFASVVAFTLATAPTAWPGPPTEQTRAHVEEVYRVLGTRGLQDASPEDRQAARKIVDKMFDWTQMARQSLGPRWKQRTPAERKEFVGLFANVFIDAYLSRIQLADAKHFQYLDDAIEGHHAVARTRVITKRGSEISVDYRVRLQEGNQWRVYDLDVEVLSLIRNYRAQFNSIITRSSYEALIKRLEQR